MKLKTILSFFLLSAFALTSCDNNRWEVATNKVILSQDFKRFDESVYQVKNEGVSAQEWDGLTTEYPDFFPLYVEGIMGFGGMNDPQISSVFNQYIANKDIAEVLEVG